MLQGSLVHKDDIADFDDPLVEVLETRGAIIIGKTNIPEFSAGKTNDRPPVQVAGSCCAAEPELPVHTAWCHACRC